MEKSAQKGAFINNPSKMKTKESLSKHIKSSLYRIVNKLRKKVETQPKATYELSLEFRTYEEDEEDTYSVVMSMENIKKRVTFKDALGDVKSAIVSSEDDVKEELMSFRDLINSLNSLKHHVKKHTY